MAVSNPGRKNSDPTHKKEARRQLRESRNFDSKARVQKDAQGSGGRASPKTKEGYLESKCQNELSRELSLFSDSLPIQKNMIRVTKGSIRS